MKAQQLLLGMLIIFSFLGSCRNDRSTNSTSISEDNSKAIARPIVNPPNSPVRSLSDSSPTIPTLTSESSLVLEPFELEAGKAAITGSLRLNKQPAELSVYLSTFVWNDTKTAGVFAFDTNTGISTEVVSNKFQIPNIDPGFYVLLIGESIEKSVVIPREDGQAQVFEVQAGQILDIGEQTIFLP